MATAGGGGSSLQDNVSRSDQQPDANDLQTDTVPLTPGTPGVQQPIPSPVISNYQQSSGPGYFEAQCRKSKDLFDFIIVYAKEDYGEVDQCKTWMENLLTRNNITDVKIELFDSEEFPPSDIANVDDIINRGMKVLLYLTPNFCTQKNLEFFSESGVYKTRIEQYPLDTRLEKERHEIRKWSLRPIHTVPERSRRSVYKTPAGIGQIHGVFYFDKDKAYSQHKFVGLAKQAKADRLRVSSLMDQDNLGVDDFLAKFNKDFERKLALEQQSRTVPATPGETPISKRDQQGQSMSLVGKPYYFPMPEGYPYSLGEQVSLTAKGEQGCKQPLTLEGQSRPENSQSPHFTRSFSENNEIQPHQLTPSQNPAMGNEKDEICDQYCKSVHNTAEMVRGVSGRQTSGSTCSEFHSENITVTSREAQSGAQKSEDIRTVERNSHQTIQRGVLNVSENSPVTDSGLAHSSGEPLHTHPQSQQSQQSQNQQQVNSTGNLPSPHQPTAVTTGAGFQPVSLSHSSSLEMDAAGSFQSSLSSTQSDQATIQRNVESRDTIATRPQSQSSPSDSLSSKELFGMGSSTMPPSDPVETEKRLAQQGQFAGGGGDLDEWKVRENVVHYDEMGRGRTAKCADLPEPDLQYSPGDLGRPQGKGSSAPTVIYHKHIHYHGVSEPDKRRKKKEEEDERKIIITGCNVVQVGERGQIHTADLSQEHKGTRSNHNDENSMDGGDWSMDSRGSMDSSLNSYGEGSWNNLSQLPLNYSNISADETTRKGSPDAGCDSSSDNEQASGELDNQPSGYEAKSSTHCDRPLNAENAAAEKMPVDFEIGSKDLNLCTAYGDEGNADGSDENDEFLDQHLNEPAGDLCAGISDATAGPEVQIIDLQGSCDLTNGKSESPQNVHMCVELVRKKHGTQRSYHQFITLPFQHQTTPPMEKCGEEHEDLD